MRYLTPVVCLFVLGALNPRFTAASELLKDHDLTGWEFGSDPAVDLKSVCEFLPDGSVAMTGKPVGFVATRNSYENYRLHAEWRWTGNPGNGGILLHISSGPKDRVWPLSLQVQTKHQNVGDLLPMAGAAFAEPLTSAPGAAPAIKARLAADSEKPAGEWNVCEVVCRGDTIEVTINGVLQNKASRLNPRAGRIGFQFEGTPFEVRHIILTPLETPAPVVK